MNVIALDISLIVFNGLTLAIALGLFLVVWWLNPRHPTNQYFAFQLFMQALWTLGILVSRVLVSIDGGAEGSGFSLRLGLIGMFGAAYALCLFTYAFNDAPVGRAMKALGVAVFLYQLWLLWAADFFASRFNDGGVFHYELPFLSNVLLLEFGIIVLLQLRFHNSGRKNRIGRIGILLFAGAEFLLLLSPRFREVSLPVSIANASALLIGLSLVHQQITSLLYDRENQLETVRDTGVAIVSRLRLDAVLEAIAGQATALLEADSAAIYRLRDNRLVLSAVYNLPRQFIGHTLALGAGVAGQVAVDSRSILLEDYAFEWQGAPDLPLAHSTFGSVVVSPLIASNQIQGILLVAQVRKGAVFNDEHVRLLELLSPQAAVAISNSELFEQQRALMDQVAVAKSQLETVLTSTQSPVIAVDRRLHVVFANPAAEGLIHSFRSDQLSEKNAAGYIRQTSRITELIPSDLFPEDLRRFLRDLRESYAHVYELNLIGRSYLCHVAPLGRPRAMGWVAVLNDVTELMELDRFKSQMVRMTSHDLKNPLFAAMSYLELLQDDLDDCGTANQLSGYVDTVMQQLDRMNRTVSSILDLERVQAGIQSRDPCYLEALVRRIAEDVKRQAQLHQLVLELDIEPQLAPVAGDQQQLEQLIANLVDNAIKFTAKGGGIQIRVTADDGGVVLSVKDTGVGIPQELHSRVFDRFYRGQQPGAEHVSGSGLGLNLVKSIVSSHEGRVWLESAPGQGTTVFVWLPYYPPD